MSFKSPEEAEAAFYEAIETADLDAMMAVWAEDEEVACIHPGGTRHAGLEDIRDGWRRIFASGQRLRFRISHRRLWHGALLAVHSVRENIAIGGQRRAVVLATNAYLLTAAGWRMVLHHASPAPEPEETEATPGPEVLH